MKNKVLKKSINTFCVVGLCALMGGTSYAWDGKKDGTGTHALIAKQGLTMLNNDLSKDESPIIKQNLKILNKYIKDLKVGSTYPDMIQTHMICIKITSLTLIQVITLH